MIKIKILLVILTILVFGLSENGKSFVNLYFKLYKTIKYLGTIKLKAHSYIKIKQKIIIYF
jgi:hypothetical protein